MSLVSPARGGPRGGNHYCPHCLRRVGAADAARRAHREPCRSGAVDVSLLQCPICGLVLAAEVEGRAVPAAGAMAV